LADTDDPHVSTSPSGFRFVWWSLAALALGLAAFAAWFMWETPSKDTFLHGVLVDLELHASDAERHLQLREALTRRLPVEEPILRGAHVSLDCVHFSEFTAEFLASRQVDFVVLSPQGTPWHRYTGEMAVHLASLKQLLKDLILSHDMPVLGICGGHQFMTLAFGGTVGFIDPRFGSSLLERYPTDAVSERGLATLETVQDDPIFAGVAAHPGKFTAMENHYEEVKQVPFPFVNLARSELSEAQLIRIPGKAVYGMAFHPERGWDAPSGTGEISTSGRRLLANFLLMVLRHKTLVSVGPRHPNSYSPQPSQRLGRVPVNETRIK
jgi:GMP synthase-like glutamine amidotransferase